MNIATRNNVTVKGSGTQTIIFAHGFGCSQNTWQAVSPFFEKIYRVVLFDYVGAGDSDLSAYDEKRYASLEGYAQDLIDICHHYQLSNCILVAHSVSCMIGTIASVKEPSLFKKMVFVSPSPYYFRDGDYDGGLKREDVDGLMQMMDTNYLGWASVLAPLAMGTPDRPELGASLTKSFCATNPDIARQFARVTFYSDCRHYLPQLKVETLTLQCREDVLAPLTIGRYINEHTPPNKLRNLQAVGHCPHLSAPKEIIESIAGFITQPIRTQTTAACCP